MLKKLIGGALVKYELTKPLSWKMGVYENPLEKRAVSAHRSFKLRPTPKNYSRFVEDKLAWLGSIGKLEGSIASAHLPSGYNGGITRMMERQRKLSYIIEDENPYKDELKAATQAHETNPSKANALRLELAEQFYHHTRVDWEIETGYFTTKEYEKDHRTISNGLGERPKDLPKIPFPRAEAQKYKFKIRTNSWNGITYVDYRKG